MMQFLFSDLLKNIFVWLLLFAVAESGMLYLSDQLIDADEIEIVESEKGESEQSEKETEQDEEDSKIGPPEGRNTAHSNEIISLCGNMAMSHIYHLEINSPPPERICNSDC